MFKLRREAISALLISVIFIAGTGTAAATTFTEPFTGYPNYVSGLTVKQNNVTIGTSSAVGVAYATASTVYMYCVNSDVVFTFPSSQSVTSFAFSAVNVGGAQPLKATYKDGAVVNFSIAAAAGISNTTTTVTFNGDGRSLASFTIVGMAVQSCNSQDPALGLDVWILSNLNWTYTVPTSTSISISGNPTALYRLPYTITASLGVAGSDGKVFFYADGKKIPNCNPLQSSGLLATCKWLPSRRGLVILTTVLKPSAAGFTTSSSNTQKVLVANRSSNR